MLDQGKTRRKLASCTLCCLAAAAAVASPPVGNNAGGMLGRASGLLAATPSRSVASHLDTASHLDFQRLDLRPPETFSGVRSSASSIGDSQAVFPSARRAQGGSLSGDEDLPGSAHVAMLRMENKVQEMERRVPREGLPVARLWETKTALLHVGLSPKGKPGLWLMQKVP